MRSRKPCDKRANRITAIPGSPGSGKSSFLVNFPASNEYRNYVLECHGSADAVVSTLTFNNLMDTGDSDLGLRILFGAAQAMGFPMKPTSWDDYLGANMGKYGFLNAKEAVRILQSTFGPNRPILLLVDELVKAQGPLKPDELVTRQLGAVLDEFGNADVLVSALSPRYVEDLATGSQRAVNYVAPSPLLKVRLGRKESKAWADRLTNPSVDSFVKDLIANVYLLYSGSPRAIERMVTEKVDSPDVAASIMSEISKEKLKIQKFLFNFLVPLMEVRGLPYLHHFDQFTPSQLEELVFSAPKFLSIKDALLMTFLETGRIFVQRMVGNVETPEFCVAVPIWSLLDWIKHVPEQATDHFSIGNSSTPRTDGARFLLSILKDSQPSAWWERLVATTIFCRSCDGDDIELNDVLGVSSTSLNSFDGPYNMDIYLAPKNTLYRALPDTNSDTNLLTIFQDNQPAFDAHVLIHGSETKGECQVAGVISMHFYLQMKIQSPQKKSTAEILAHDLSFTVLNHVLRYVKGGADGSNVTDLHGEVHYVLYNWGLGRGGQSPDDLPPNLKANVLKALNKATGGVSPRDHVTTWFNEKIAAGQIGGKGALLPGNFDDLVTSYVEQHFDTNVHVVDGPKLDDWLLPSFLPLPMMLTDLGIDT